MGGNRILAAGVPRAAFGQAHDGQSEAREEAMLLQRRAGVVRACRSKAATAGRVDDDERGRKGALIDPDEPAEGASGQGKETPVAAVYDRR